jgi:hypothetical protein
VNDELRRKLASEAGAIAWTELERHFARGALIVVAPELDLIDVAARIAEDDAVSVGRWMNSDQVVRASDEHARLWGASRRLLRAVVVAPWVLVQETRVH